MPDDPSLQEILRDTSEHIGFLVRRAYEAGKRAGFAEASDKVAGALGMAAISPSQFPLPSLPVANRDDSLSAGATVSRPIRDAISQMPIGPNGVGPREVTAFMHNALPQTRSITEQQVRAGMKTLLNRDDLERVSRGKYRLSAKLSNQAPAAVTEAGGGQTREGAEQEDTDVAASDPPLFLMGAA